MPLNTLSVPAVIVLLMGTGYGLAKHVPALCDKLPGVPAWSLDVERKRAFRKEAQNKWYYMANGKLPNNNPDAGMPDWMDAEKPVEQYPYGKNPINILSSQKQ